MADRYTKHIPTGQVFIYQEAFASREDFEECADAAGNPMVEVKAGLKPLDAVVKGGKKEKAAQESINAEASKGL